MTAKEIAALKVAYISFWRLWKECSTKEYRKAEASVEDAGRDNDERSLSMDGAGIFYRVGRVIYRSQYGGTEKLTCKSVADAKAAMDLIWSCCN